MAAILPNEIVTYPSISIVDGDANGGRMNHLIELPNNAVGVFPDILEAQRLDGRIGTNALTQKVFRCVRNAENKTYTDALLYLGFPFDAAGHVLEITPATHTSVWSDVKSLRRYGVGNLSNAPAFNGATGKTTIVVQTAGSGFNHFQVNDEIIITNQLSTTDSTGTMEVLTIESATYVGTECTIIVNGRLRYNYQPTRLSGGVTINTRVASCAPMGDVKCGFSASANSSAAGTFDPSKILARNMGAKHQTITVQFNSATTFTAISNQSEIGSSVVSGSVAATWEPQDNFGQPMLSVPSEAWGGTWASGDSIQIHITPPAMPVFLVIQVQAGSPAFESQQIPLWSFGHSSSATVV
jgi:hypothetical protein